MVEGKSSSYLTRRRVTRVATHAVQRVRSITQQQAAARKNVWGPVRGGKATTTRGKTEAKSAFVRQKQTKSSSIAETREAAVFVPNF